MTEIRLALEVGQKKTFASALDWPGWSRSGNDVPSSIDTLLSYRDRYNDVIRLAGLHPLPSDQMATTVVEEVSGDSTTDFGAPGTVVDSDREVLDGDALERQLALLRASWAYFDQVAATVTPEMRKGPRGGGRDRDAIIDHVLECERTYARRIGVRNPRMAIDDRGAIDAHRAAIIDGLENLAAKGEIPAKGWPPRYAIRRTAWHVLDHAWEMQDKDLSGNT